eukprot:XP_001197321.2 PREDICTED: glyoxylate/hydroxypyruvate reductase A HPR2 [Strongylocentrotus purpuratus]
MPRPHPGRMHAYLGCGALVLRMFPGSVGLLASQIRHGIKASFSRSSSYSSQRNFYSASRVSMMSTLARSPSVVVYSECTEGPKGIKECLKTISPKIFEGCTFVDRNEEPLSDESVESFRKAEIVLMDTERLPALMTTLENVKWVQSTWAGVDAFINKIDPALLPPKFTLTRLAGVFGTHMAEYVIGHILAHERSFKFLWEAQQKKEWALDEYSATKGYQLLAGRTISVIGAGDIGTEIGKVCKAFNMRVIGLVRRDVPKEQRNAAFDEYRLTEELPYVLEEADFIVNVLPSTEQTMGFFSGNTLSHCKKKPVFINVGRGDVIDEASLINAIKEGWICHAVLDVYKPEPLPKESPIWTMPEVTITPHVSAQTHAPEITGLFADNYQRYINGETLRHQINWAAKY